MENTLSTINLVVTNILVIIGIFIIVSGAMKTIWEFIRYKRSKKEELNKGLKAEFENFQIIRSHLTFSIILAMPLFLIKLLDDAVRSGSSTQYLYLLGLTLIFVFMVIAYKKKI